MDYNCLITHTIGQIYKFNFLKIVVESFLFSLGDHFFFSPNRKEDRIFVLTSQEFIDSESMLASLVFCDWSHPSQLVDLILGFRQLSEFARSLKGFCHKQMLVSQLPYCYSTFLSFYLKQPSLIPW